jgi:uncharacterized membrane protein YphA (DoxX/SURF4 family)
MAATPAWREDGGGGAMKYLTIGGTWLLTILMAVLMVGPGSQKFTGNTWARMFREWGYPDGFYLVIGAIEVIGGIALLVPRFASASAIVLMCVMIGAAATQVWNGSRNGVGEIVQRRRQPLRDRADVVEPRDGSALDVLAGRVCRLDAAGRGLRGQ